MTALGIVAGILFPVFVVGVVAFRIGHLFGYRDAINSFMDSEIKETLESLGRGEV